MSDFLLRPAAAADEDDLVRLWTRAFGDGPAFVRALLRDAGLPATALCAEADGRVRAAMYAFEGLRFGGVPAAYLYALATEPEARGRGLGGAVVTALARRSFARGAELVCLSPADPGLAAWYAARGFRPGQPLADLPLAVSHDGGRCTPLSAAEYLAARESALGLTPQLLAAQSVLHRFGGGGFFRVAAGGVTAYACAEPTEDGLLIRELLCPAAAYDAVGGALAAHFSLPRVLLRRPAADGGRLFYIMSASPGASPLSNAEFPGFPYLLE
jgi:ribosomal protein S18 acetylase RimI-like enzyme